MAGLSVTEDRLLVMDFTDSYATGVQVIIVKEGSDVTIDNMGEGLIGTQRGTTGNIYCTDDYGEDHVIAYDDGIVAVQDLLNGKVDAVVIDKAPAQEFVSANPGLVILDTEYANEDYAIGVAKGNTALVDAAWNVMKVEIPQTPDEMDAMIQDLIVDQLEKNGIDDTWLVEAANKNELVQQVASLGETMSLTFYDADDNVIDMDLNFESAADINQLLTVFRVNAGGLFDVTGARDENNQPTAFGGAVRTTIIEEAQDELIAKMNESETIKDLIGDNEDLQNYLLYSALVSLDLDFDAEKEEAYQGGAVLADLDISSIATEKMTELLEDELAQVSVKDYLDEDDSYQDKIDLLNSLKFPNVTEQTFAGLAAKLRGQTVADLIGSRGDSYVEKYLGRIVESGDTEDVYCRPMHPYTQALLSAIPKKDPAEEKVRIRLEGDVPSPASPPPGCAFHNRCPHCMDICTEQAPASRELEPGHCVACHLYDASRS